MLARCGASAASVGTTSTQADPGPTSTGADGSGPDATDPGSEDTSTESGDATGTTNEGGDFSHGKAHVDLTGAATLSGDLGIDPIYSMFETESNDSAIVTFVDAAGATSLTINSSPKGSFVTLASADYGVSLLPVNGVLGSCTVTMADLDGDSAIGTFSSEHIAIVKGGDTILGEGTLIGSFDAYT